MSLWFLRFSQILYYPLTKLNCRNKICSNPSVLNPICCILLGQYFRVKNNHKSSHQAGKIAPIPEWKINFCFAHLYAFMSEVYNSSWWKITSSDNIPSLLLPIFVNITIVLILAIADYLTQFSTSNLQSLILGWSANS